MDRTFCGLEVLGFGLVALDILWEVCGGGKFRELQLRGAVVLSQGLCGLVVL